MKNRAEEIRKKIAKRRKKYSQGKSPHPMSSILPKDEEKHGIPPFYEYESETKQSAHPLIRKDWFLFQVMAAVCLFLLVGIMHKSTSPIWVDAKMFVENTFEREFQFAVVEEWYENEFGKPLALFPTKQKSDSSSELVNKEEVAEPVFAVPAAGRVMESFADNGQGIMVETGKKSEVEAVNAGFVRFIGMKDNIGKTVVLQHSDGSETWYGNLQDINVQLYDFVKIRTPLGKAAASDNGKAGQFYFAYKKGESFIDPMRVIPFE